MASPLKHLIPTGSLENVRREMVPAQPVIQPTLTARSGDLNIKLFVAQRKLPFLIGNTLTQNNALLVPVAPDLRMVFGVAKLARDWGADIAQREALKVAPLAPGDAFIGTGARYRYRHTVLAVVFDENKRATPDLMRQAIRRGAQLAGERGATGLILPDMTENLLAQPNWITAQQRSDTAEIVAFTLVDALKSCRGFVKTVHLWCWDPRNAEYFQRELKRLK